MKFLKYWYLDRDFPEIKESNSMVIGYCHERDQAKKICDTHNEIVDDIDCKLMIAVATLDKLLAGFTGMFGHENVSFEEDAKTRGVEMIERALKKIRENHESETTDVSDLYPQIMKVGRSKEIIGLIEAVRELRSQTMRTYGSINELRLHRGPLATMLVHTIENLEKVEAILNKDNEKEIEV